MKQTKKRLASILVFALLCSVTATSPVSHAAVRLSPKKIVFKKPGQKKTVKIKGVAKKKVRSLRVSSRNTAVAETSTAGRNKLTVWAMGSGKTVISVKFKVKKKNGKLKSYSKKLTVTVKKVDPEDDVEAPMPGVSAEPGSTTAPVQSGSPATAAPNATIDPDISVTYRIQDIPDQPYTGKAVNPTVYLVNKSNPEKRLKENYYSVTYGNNTNVGTATVSVKGINGFTGELTGSFTIVPSQATEPPVTSPGMTAGPTPTASAKPAVTLSKSEIPVGGTASILADASLGRLTYSTLSSVSSPVTISTGGVIRGDEPGVTTVFATTTAGKRYTVGEISVYNNTSPYISIDSGSFFVSPDQEEYKFDTVTSKFASTYGTATVTIHGSCSATFMKQRITVKVRDVTPSAYHNVFAYLGMNEETLKITGDKIENAPPLAKMTDSIVGREEGVEKETPVSVRTLTIKSSRIMRDILIDVYQGDKRVDCEFVTLMPERSKTDDIDEAFYRDIRHRIENNLWTAQMTNKEKLVALADYISETAHYPGSPATSFDTNNDYWSQWSVEGLDLHYNMFRTKYLDRAMVLQGGIVDDSAVEIILEAAVEDLKLKDYTKSGAKTGEGVWISVGKESTTPTIPTHESLWYRDAEGNLTGIDAEGQKTPCNGSECENRIIPLD